MGRRPNALHDDCEYDPTDPEGFRGGHFQPASAASGNALAVKVFELPPGQAICPYHYEYEEEWLIVLEGAVTLRAPAGEEQLERGAIVSFPPGPEGAHKVTNDGAETARVVMFSSAREPAVAVYPDSDKIGVWPGNAEDEVILHRRDGAVDYFEGETGSS
jgi:uncharacterized cupin superfamily protein